MFNLKLQKIFPFIILIGFLLLFWYELFYPASKQKALALVGEKVPNFSLATLTPPYKNFTQKDLQGKVSLVNIWATWCHACNLEHPILLNISREYHVPIYAITYRDKTDAVQRWLNEKGNPYVLVANDATGTVAVDFGIYGTPETFVISPAGKIIYRHIGAIDQSTWENILYPLIKKYQ